ncbi:E3 ubiquitin-protein ligase RNF4-like [Helianthus annuus]|uniref:E3 ubiquitin-protein ligase RNF4-like n=1 Tax=Helianthus annuus TaxID=4232 RepID=UPI001652C0E1|nr:E3 ubiquitin-protein ligase RNF4-like [Helianthus annuus]
MAEIAARNQRTDPVELNLQPPTVINYRDNEQWKFLGFGIDIPSNSLGSERSKGATRHTGGFISRPNPSTMNSQSNFLDLEFTFPAIPLGQSCQRGQPDIPEDSFLDLTLQYTPCDPVSPDEAFNDDAGSSRRARETYTFDSESEISARNQQSDPLEHNLQPSTVITESHVAPVAPLPPPSPPLPTYTCPICLGPMTEETTTRCGHIFCKGCIKSSLSTGDKCPICRHRITPRGLHRLYFYDAL